MKPKFVISFDVITSRSVNSYISEMAAQLYNTEIKCVVDEFYIWILPRHYNTGIGIPGAHHVALAPVLTRAMPKFMHWIENLKEKHGVLVTPDGQKGNCFIVTWSDYALNALDVDLRAVNVTPPSMFDFAVDIRDMIKTTDPKVYDNNQEITIRQVMIKMDIDYYRYNECNGSVNDVKGNAIEIAELACHMIASGRWTKYNSV